VCESREAQKAPPCELESGAGGEIENLWDRSTAPSLHFSFSEILSFFFFSVRVEKSVFILQAPKNRSIAMSHALSGRVAAAAPTKCGVRQQQRLASARFARSTTTKRAAESASSPPSSSPSTSSTSTSSTATDQPAAAAAAAFSRRDALFSAAAAASALSAVSSSLLTPLPARAGDAAAVGTYLPKSSTIEGFSHYQPSNTETPSIRAGVIKADPTRGFYSFDLPSNWRPQKMANVLTGNFCMPRCDEPWTECIFADPAEGSVKVVVSPLRRLTNKASVAISDVGPPAAIISSLGSFVTGNQPPEEEEVAKTSREEGVSGPVYTYEVRGSFFFFISKRGAKKKGRGRGGAR